MVREVKEKSLSESKLPLSGGLDASDGLVSAVILQITVINTQASGTGQMCRPVNYMLHECEHGLRNTTWFSLLTGLIE